VRTLAEQPHVHVAQHGAEAVGILEQGLAAVLPTGAQLVVTELRTRHGRALEQAPAVDQCERPGAPAGNGLRRHGARQEGPHHRVERGGLVHAQHRKRVTVAALAERLDLVGCQQRGDGFHGLGVRPQTSRAYSRIVRSDEKKPMPATFAIAFFAQAAGWS
jgi:hypothetical protein